MIKDILLQFKLYIFEEVKFKMENLNHMDIIEDYNRYLSRIPSGCAYLIEELRAENKEVISRELMNFAEGLVWMMKVDKYFATLDIKVDFDGEKLNELLEEINKLLQNKDFYAIADIFEYEIIELFKEFSPIAFSEE